MMNSVTRATTSVVGGYHQTQPYPNRMNRVSGQRAVPITPLKICGGEPQLDRLEEGRREAMRGRLAVAFASAAIANAAVVDQHPWHSPYGTGKPAQMLQVGRLPHLGCSTPFDP